MSLILGGNQIPDFAEEVGDLGKSEKDKIDDYYQ
jgi:hypothetical protein